MFDKNEYHRSLDFIGRRFVHWVVNRYDFSGTYDGCEIRLRLLRSKPECYLSWGLIE